MPSAGVTSLNSAWVVLRLWLLGRRNLEPRIWQNRHSFVLGVLVVHVPLLMALALFASPSGFQHNLLDLLPVLVLTFMAWRLQTMRGRELSASAGLLVCSAAVIHIGGGWVELHFHFFLALALVALYQSRLILAIAVVFVFGHHLLLGLMMPDAVWANGANRDNPMEWAVIHAIYVAVVAAAQLIFWRNTDEAKHSAEEAYRRLWEGEQAVVEQLRSAERIKDELVATVSHEFRTPLASVMGFGQLLQDAGPDLSVEDRMKYVEHILTQSARLDRLVTNLLNTMKDIQVSEEATTDAAIVAQSVVAELSSISGSNRTLDLEVEAGCFARISADALHQILINLITNAIKFSPEESIVRIRVSDSGAGTLSLDVRNACSRPLTERDLGRMFEPFVQLDSSDTRPAPGIGLGLAIARRLAAAYGGNISATPLGDEVIFSVCLPLAQNAVGEKSVLESKA